MLILTLFIITLIVVICFICLLYFVVRVLDTRYCICLIDKEYQLIEVNSLEKYIDYSTDTRYIEEREYLNITLISFVFFIIYLSCANKEERNFFDRYFDNYSDNIVY